MTAYDLYEPVIGLEVHVQLSTRSKAFCGDSAAFGGEPNEHISPLSLGYPGTLPRLNRRQVEYAVRLGLALGCEISPVTAFDRKNYFYADLPKGYQLTQDRFPVCRGGVVTIRVDGVEKAIRLHHIHMEEDAGKSIHDQHPQYSYVDLNRAGVPLLEIVSEPDLRSGEEVAAYMHAIRQLVRYLGISDGNMEEGSLRCDINVSVRRKGSTVLGERCEVKNVNSMRFAKKAVEFEFRRQVDLLEGGDPVERHTLHFDAATGTTSPLRGKESAHDYRYFPDPDLLPVVLEAAWIEALRQSMPPLPEVLFNRLRSEYNLPEADAHLLCTEKETALFYIGLCEMTSHHKAAANLLINRLLPHLEATGTPLDQFPLGYDALAALLELTESGKISHSIAFQRLWPAMLEQPGADPEALARQHNLLQSEDSAFLQDLIATLLVQHPDKVAEYRKGKKGLTGFFMGELMKLSKGRAEPKAASRLLEAALKG